MGPKSDFLKEKSIDNLFTAWFSRNLDGRWIENWKVGLTSEYDQEMYCHPHIVQNILGFIEQKYDKKSNRSTQLFKDVLNEDPYNINALNGLIHIYKFMGNDSEALKYQKKYDDVYQCEERQQKLSYARSVLEHAVFMASLGEQFISRNFRKIIAKYDEVLAIGKELEKEDEEIIRWKFALGFLHVRIDSVLGIREDETCVWLKSCIQILYDVATTSGRVEAGDKVDKRFDYKGTAWGYIGVTLNRKYPQKNLKLSQFINSIDPKYADWDSFNCFDHALEIAVHSPVLLRRVGQAFTKKTELMDKAQDYLEKSLEMQPVAYTYSLLGRLFLTKYKCDNAKIDDLQRAIDLLETGIQKKCDLFSIFQYLAEAYEYNGQLENALHTLAHCENTHDGPRKVELYELWADLLDKNGNSSAAHKKRKLAEDTLAGRNPKQARDFGVLYDDKDDNEVIQLVEAIEQKFDVCGFFMKRDLIPGDNFINGLVKMGRECKTVMIFISENFNDSSARNNELNQIIFAKQDSENESIIPLVFGKGKVPDSLKHVSPLTYDLKSKLFWDKLEKKFHGSSNTSCNAFHNLGMLTTAAVGNHSSLVLIGVGVGVGILVTVGIHHLRRKLSL